MKKLDLYIIKKYWITFFFTVILMTIVSIAMDASERIGKFMTHDLSFKQVWTEYYIFFIPWINGELWPLFAFLAVIFFTSRIARDSEVIAMLSAGIDYARILRPMVIAASILAAIHWFAENYVIPSATHHKTEVESKYIKTSLKRPLANNVQFFISPTSKIYCQYFKVRDSSLVSFRLETFDEQGQLTSMFKANNLIFKSEPNLWTAKDYEIRSFSGLEETMFIGHRQEIDTVINMHPSDFIRHSKEMEILPTPQLKEHIQSERAKGLDHTKPYEIEVYKRTSGPFTIIILTLIGATIGTRKVRGGLGMHLALGLALGSVYTVMSKFSETFAPRISASTVADRNSNWLPRISSHPSAN